MTSKSRTPITATRSPNNPNAITVASRKAPSIKVEIKAVESLSKFVVGPENQGGEVSFVDTFADAVRIAELLVLEEEWRLAGQAGKSTWWKHNADQQMQRFLDQNKP